MKFCERCGKPHSTLTPYCETCLDEIEDDVDEGMTQREYEDKERHGY